MVSQDMIAVPCRPPLRFAVVGAPAYFKGPPKRGKPKTPADLARHDCIRSRMPGGIFRWEFEKRGELLAIDVKGSLTLDHHHLMIEAALAGSGLMWGSEWSVAPYIAEVRLLRVLEDWTPLYPGLCLYYPGHRHVPAGLRAFIAMVREAVSFS